MVSGFSSLSPKTVASRRRRQRSDTENTGNAKNSRHRQRDERLKYACFYFFLQTKALQKYSSSAVHMLFLSRGGGRVELLKSEYVMIPSHCHLESVMWFMPVVLFYVRQVSPLQVSSTTVVRSIWRQNRRVSIHSSNCDNPSISNKSTTLNTEPPSLKSRMW